jgi:hypothetical protein
VLGLNVVHDCKTMCLEDTRCHLLHPETPL